MKKIIAIIGIAALVLWSGWRFWYALAVRAVDGQSASRVSVTIPSGSSTADIAELLEEKGVIRSSSAFAIAARRSGKSGSLQAGTFVLTPAMTVQQVIDALSSGETQEMSVTVPEGYTVKDIDALLASKGLITAGDFILCARTCVFSSFGFLPSGTNQADRGGRIEGYLYPDTYFIAANQFDAQAFAERLLSVFRRRIVDDLADDIQASGRTLHEIVTMASLIEEETRTDEERPVVAGILWKRYDEGMGLYVDASNRYILHKPTQAITAADLDMDSPYNLRKYRGLPPGPIANPGLKSILAALHPQSSSYYYYLHGSDGIIRYAVTNDEHNLNKARYLK